MFRLGIGAIILNQNKEIIAFRRVDFPENWQGPEGGLDQNESALEGLYREVKEEISLEKNMYSILKETTHFIPYLFKNVKANISKDFIGQKKKFFLLQLNNNFTKFQYDTLKNEQEFSEHKIMNALDLVKATPNFKKELYIKVLTEFGLL